MAKFSTGLRNGMLTDVGFLEALDGGVLKIFSAQDVPASADAAETGVLLMTLTAGGDGTTGLTFDPPVAGVLSKSPSEVWMTPSVDTAGTCAYFRFVAQNDDGTASDTAPRVQGTVGAIGADMNLTNTTVTAGTPWTLNYFHVGLPSM